MLASKGLLFIVRPQKHPWGWGLGVSGFGGTIVPCLILVFFWDPQSLNTFPGILCSRWNVCCLWVELRGTFTSRCLKPSHMPQPLPTSHRSSHLRRPETGVGGSSSPHPQSQRSLGSYSCGKGFYSVLQKAISIEKPKLKASQTFFPCPVLPWVP